MVFLCQAQTSLQVTTSFSEWLVLYSFGHKVCSSDSLEGLPYPSSRPSFTLQITHRADSLAWLQTCVSIWEPSKQNLERSAKLLMSDPGNWMWANVNSFTWTTLHFNSVFPPIRRNPLRGWIVCLKCTLSHQHNYLVPKNTVWQLNYSLFEFEMS